MVEGQSILNKIFADIGKATGSKVSVRKKTGRGQGVKMPWPGSYMLFFFLLFFFAMFFRQRTVRDQLA